jgi:endonuclease/exonuclease/phosphatase family metal-dependent hydrolase
MKYCESAFMLISGLLGKTGFKKQSRRIWIAGLLPVFVIGFGGCNAVSGDRAGQAVDADGMKTLIIATWNVQALFDGEENNTEYAEYRMTAGWSEEKYRARLTALVDAVAHITEGVPDVLALQEVENETVLKELAEGPLAKYGYSRTFFANNPGASLGVGLLSRLPLLEPKVHSVTYNENTSPRPVAEVRVEPGKMPIALFICHWKSKVEGDDATEGARRASARVVLRRLREIRAEEPDLPVIVMGDLNENYDEFYRRAGPVVCALLPDDPEAAELWGKARRTPVDFLVISGQKPPLSRYFSYEAEALYSPWGNEMEKGSYYYRNNWETIDHFLLSAGFFDGQGWEFDACEALYKEPFINDQGIPRTYNPRTGNGLSDHLPLLLKLKRQD